MTHKITSVDNWNQLSEIDKLVEVNRILLRRVAELEGILNLSASPDEPEVYQMEITKKSKRTTGVRLRLSEHKNFLGLTWDALADKTGIPRDHLIALDRGYAIQCNVRYIPGLAKFFSIGINDLIVGDVELPIQSRRSKRKTRPTEVGT